MVRRLVILVLLGGVCVPLVAPPGSASARERYSARASRELVAALRAGDTARLGVALAEGANPDALVDGRPALEIAAERGLSTIAVALLINGATPSSEALVAAAGHGDGEVVDQLLQRGGDARDPRALAAAAGAGADLVVAQLLVHGADASLRLPNGENALHAAARAAHVDTLRTLLRGGADPTDRGPDGTPEDVARSSGHRDAMQFLHNWRALGEQLWEAAGRGDAVEVERLLDGGADPDCRHQGLGPHSALAYAADKGDSVIVDLLLARGADPDSKSSLGDTALLRAAQRGHAAVVRRLLEAGADPSWSSPNVGTARDVAARNGFAEVVEMLERRP